MLMKTALLLHVIGNEAIVTLFESYIILAQGETGLLHGANSTDGVKATNHRVTLPLLGRGLVKINSQMHVHKNASTLSE